MTDLQLTRQVALGGALFSLVGTDAVPRKPASAEGARPGDRRPSDDLHGGEVGRHAIGEESELGHRSVGVHRHRQLAGVGQGRDAQSDVLDQAGGGVAGTAQPDTGWAATAVNL